MNIKFDSKLIFLIKKIAKRFKEHEINAYSAQMAFFMILSIFPFFIFIFTLIGHLSINSETLIILLKRLFPKEVHSLVFSFIEEYILIKDLKIISFSIIGTLWSASKGIRGLIISLNKAYEVKETKNFLIVKLLDIIYTIIFVFGILIFLTIPNIGLGVYNFFNQYININWEIYRLYNIIKMTFLPIMMVFLMSTIYKYMPNIKLHFTEVIYGVIFSIFGWTGLSYIFSILIKNFFNFKVLYGSLATFIILMFWLYFSSMILIIGGEINSIIKKYKGLSDF